MRRTAFLITGYAVLALGAVGILVPLLPTVPFVILAAFCFARSSPALERRLVEHPTFGPHIQAWRERGAISRRGKLAAALAFGASAAIAAVALPWLAAAIPALAALIGGAWILSRPA